MNNGRISTLLELAPQIIDIDDVNMYNFGLFFHIMR
jgi:hypothetical protein